MISLTVLLKADLQTEACLKGGFMSRTRITIFMSPHFCLHLYIFFALPCSVRLNSASLSFPSHFLNFIDSPLFLSLSLFTLQWQAVPYKLPLSKWEFESIQLTHQPALFFSPSSVFLSFFFSLLDFFRENIIELSLHKKLAQPYNTIIIVISIRHCCSPTIELL